MIRNFSICMALLFAGPVAAEDIALVIGNENYRNAADISAADDAGDAADVLAEGGFTLVRGRDLTAPDMARLSARFYSDLEPADRVVILLAGHFAQAGKETWFLPVDAAAPGL
ncbi:MAG: caspase family protein, partial [Albidovulum sp.]